MTKEELFKISIPEDNEKQLKLKLMKNIDEFGFNKTFLFLAIKNQLLLNSCNIDENSFNQMLFKNYIFQSNNNTKISLEKLSPKDREIIGIFETSINNNNFEDALKIYNNNYIVYQYLCTMYINALPEPDLIKINRIPDNKISDVYNKILLLKNTKLISKKETDVKIYKKVSNK